jgi:phospho-N-acetylmuramoyl-pentapeptide-transferase
LVLAVALAYPIFLALLKLNSRQKVSEYAPETHQAKQGTPTMGGLMFVVPFLICSLVPGWRGSTPLTVVFFLFALIGFVDDFVVPRLFPGKRGLGWKQKLLMQFAAALLFAWQVERGADLHLESMAFEVFSVLFCANAYNFADGLDGLAASIGLLIFPGLIVASDAVGGGVPIAPVILLAGAMIPFAYLNAPKAKVFMGDVGSLPVGAFIGALVALSVKADFGVHDRNAWAQPSDPWFAMTMAILVFVLIAELVPVPLQIFWVKVFKRRLFPFTPIHHAFEKAGWPETRVVALFALVQLLCTLGAITILMTSQNGLPGFAS